MWGFTVSRYRKINTAWLAVDTGSCNVDVGSEPSLAGGWDTLCLPCVEPVIMVLYHGRNKRSLASYRRLG